MHRQLLMAKMLIETMAVDQRLQVNRQEIGCRIQLMHFANGATEGLKLALNVAAMLISFYAFILLINYFLSFIGSFSFLQNLISMKTYHWLQRVDLMNSVFKPFWFLFVLAPGLLVSLPLRFLRWAS